MTSVVTDSVTIAREATREALHASIERLDPRMRHVCGYHLGLWDADGVPTGLSGKGVRPELVLISTAATNRDPLSAVPAAVAVELVHNFSLVHDDVMDGDESRRHRPTVWAAFGLSTALLAGDALLALAGEVLAEAPSPTVGYAVQALSATTRRLIAGQAADLAFETRPDVALEECLRMEADKTGALLACACSIGPMLADAPACSAAALAEFGERVGIAFQLDDDLLGIWGATERTGKPVLSDLRSRKKSAPIVAALTSGTAAGAALRALYRQEAPLDEDELARAAELVEEAGGRTWAERRAAAELDAALRLLAEAFPDPHRAAPLAAMATRLAGRDH
ncbi:dimethylallyltranstransferase [Intrasporangium chromatireducens Q5-1]|uniref:Dimethylallyltranstransferase n=1 Tax=Intrasporangium chromatireducens Q5-1 TaxID=584657 RepID=W9GS50_9MICO|nr:polyprenyl synthetase family protein [Intrasporangium chromatireducens]EWT07892.1 dimethylallyltranstransferase [Intrasporangium chromatireducens Q5-1]